MTLDAQLLDELTHAVAARLVGSDRAPAALEPLGSVLGISPEAARMREASTPGLRALAVTVGRRRYYRRHDVVRFFAGMAVGSDTPIP